LSIDVLFIISIIFLKNLLFIGHLLILFEIIFYTWVETKGMYSKLTGNYRIDKKNENCKIYKYVLG